MFRLNTSSVRLIPVAGVLCWVAALFYFIYIKNYEAPGFLILVMFFGYFTSQRNWGGSDNASNPFKFLQQDGGSPIRELAKGLGCVVVGAAIAAAAGLTIPNVELAVAIALTAGVVGFVAFVLFLLRAFSAWGSGRGSLE
jgi:hypothetical protein